MKVNEMDNTTKKKVPRWTPEEMAYLKKNYNKIPIRDIVKHLGKTLGAIRIQAFKNRLTVPHNKNYNKKLYNVWWNIKYRFAALVCKEWSTYDNFLKWAESSGYKDGLALSSKDIKGKYTTNNCHWIEKWAWNYNKSNNRVNETIVRAILTAKFVDGKNNIEVYAMFPTVPPTIIYQILKEKHGNMLAQT